MKFLSGKGRRVREGFMMLGMVTYIFWKLQTRLSAKQDGTIVTQTFYRGYGPLHITIGDGECVHNIQKYRMNSAGKVMG